MKDKYGNEIDTSWRNCFPTDHDLQRIINQLTGNFATTEEKEMQRYVGIKTVNAKPMTRQEYNNFRFWPLPSDEDGNDEGYLVEYIDGGEANTKEYDGYVSWSPADVFERAYSNSLTQRLLQLDEQIVDVVGTIYSLSGCSDTFGCLESIQTEINKLIDMLKSVEQPK